MQHYNWKQQSSSTPPSFCEKSEVFQYTIICVTHTAGVLFKVWYQGRDRAFSDQLLHKTEHLFKVFILNAMCILA